MKVEFFVGIKELLVLSNRPCHRHQQQSALINVSFTLEGAFLNAAISDSLCETVDYDALCTTLWRHLSEITCEDSLASLKEAQNIIRQFSAKITGGYVSLHICCHEPFIVRQALL